MYLDRSAPQAIFPTDPRFDGNGSDWWKYYAYQTFDLKVVEGPNQSEHPGLVQSFVLDDVLGVLQGTQPQICWLNRRDHVPISLYWQAGRQTGGNKLQLSGWITVTQECKPPQEWIVVADPPANAIYYLTPYPIPEGAVFFPLRKFALS